MPIVNLQRNISLNQSGTTNLGDPSLIASGGTTYVDLSIELSKLYGKTIRQGNSFKVCAIQTALRPVGSGYDTGLAATTRVGYIPETKHSRSAWNQAFKTWQRQKRLYAGATGTTVRYDDFELAYDVDHINGRTSQIFQSGIDDTSKDACVLWGTSNNSVFALSDFYDDMNPVAPVSKYSWNNSVVKESKFEDKFPYPREFFVTGSMASVVTDDGNNALTSIFPGVSLGTNMLSGATATAPIHEFPEPAKVLAGLMKFESYVVADDTAVQYPDTATLEIVIHVKSWKSLVYQPRTKNWMRGRKGKKGRRAQSSKSKRYKSYSRKYYR